MTFYDKVYKVASKIPKGKVSTYKEIAKALNSRAYRAVGKAMNKNPYSYNAVSPEATRVYTKIVQKRVWARARNRCSVIRGDSKRTSRSFLVCCHRVINSDGRVGNFNSGTKKKIQLLRKEGIEVIKGKVDLKKYLFKLK